MVCALSSIITANDLHTQQKRNCLNTHTIVSLCQSRERKKKWKKNEVEKEHI